MSSIWNMCLQRWADHRFWTLSHSGAAPEASGSFSVVFVCEEEWRCEHFCGPSSHARALFNCQPALASPHIKVVFVRFSVSAFLDTAEPALVNDATNGCDLPLRAARCLASTCCTFLCQRAAETVLLQTDEACGPALRSPSKPANLARLQHLPDG